MAEREVRSRDVALDLVEERREVVGRSAPERERARRDGRVDQEVTGRGDREAHGLGRRLDGLGLREAEREGQQANFHHPVSLP